MRLSASSASSCAWRAVGTSTCQFTASVRLTPPQGRFVVPKCTEHTGQYLCTVAPSPSMFRLVKERALWRGKLAARTFVRAEATVTIGDGYGMHKYAFDVLTDHQCEDNWQQRSRLCDVFSCPRTLWRHGSGRRQGRPRHTFPTHNRLGRPGQHLRTVGVCAPGRRKHSLYGTETD